MAKTFNIRINRIVNKQMVRTYIDVEADNEVEALEQVIELMKKATHEETESRERRRDR